jgi:CheY-like chemotaxis protein
MPCPANHLAYAPSAQRATDAPRDKALRLIATKPDIGLVLADFAMPEMNGVELARAVHATRPTLPVILVTGYCDHDLLKEFGDSRILQKPYTEGDLVDKIAAALN